MAKYEKIEHPSDEGFRAFGESLEEAFENAALALMDIIVDNEKVEAIEEIEIELEAEDYEALLYDWLDYFLYLQGARNIVVSKFQVTEITEIEEGFRLKGKAWGEKYDKEKHGYGTEVKAVTYHMMEVECDSSRCYVQVVVDV